MFASESEMAAEHGSFSPAVYCRDAAVPVFFGYGGNADRFEGEVLSNQEPTSVR